MPVGRRSFSLSGGAASSSSAACCHWIPTATTALEGERALGFSGAALIARLPRMRLNGEAATEPASADATDTTPSKGTTRRQRQGRCWPAAGQGKGRGGGGARAAQLRRRARLSLEAKASATQAAIIRQTYVTQELQVRACGV